MKNTYHERQTHGVVLLDKPAHISSNAALQHVKKLFRARKAGHTGSLDVLATGLLPVCLGEATKIAGFLLDIDKRYEFECTLGVVTATGDAEGEVLSTQPVPSISHKQLEAILSQFHGEIQQTPPMYSAMKHQGRPLYQLARQGVTVERHPRPVKIYSLICTKFDGTYLSLAAHCSKGTYIRTLAEDIGQALGCGAHVSALRRVAVGGFTASQMTDIPTLEAARRTERLEQFLIPTEQALKHWPAVHLTETLAYYVCNGQSVQVPYAPAQGMVRLFVEDTRFLGVGEILQNGRVAPRRLLHCQS